MVGFALLLVIFRGPEQPAWADEVTTGARTVLAWYPFDARFFYANAVATGFAARGEYRYSIWRDGLDCAANTATSSTFKELARSGQDNFSINWISPKTVRNAAPGADLRPRPGQMEPGAVTSSVTLPSSATIEQVKEAFKRLVKQNHPDRLHDMSPALRTLAETETKRLNAAFRQALVIVSRPNTALN